MFLLHIILFNFFIIISFTIRDMYKYHITFNEYLQRYSIYNYKLKQYDYLIHGASCGEVVSSLPIVKLLKKNKKKVIVSCHTVRGIVSLKINLGM